MNVFVDTIVNTDLGLIIVGSILLIALVIDWFNNPRPRI